MDKLSTKVRPKKKYKTDRKDLDGRSGKGTSPMAVVKKAPDIAMKTTQERIPSLKPVYDRYKCGDSFKSAFGCEQGIISSKFWRQPTAEEEKAKVVILNYSLRLTKMENAVGNISQHFSIETQKL